MIIFNIDNVKRSVAKTTNHNLDACLDYSERYLTRDIINIHSLLLGTNGIWFRFR